MTPDPFFSIITATFQAGRRLPELIRSLEQQTFQNFEWVVRDGGSTDSTEALIVAGSLQNIDFVSKPDRGIYDALNSAIGAARGEYLLFLGADDQLMGPDVLERAFAALAGRPGKPDALLCSVVDEDGRRFRSRLSATTLVFNTVHHQGVFYRASVFHDFRYDVDSRVVADYELNLLLFVRGHRTESLDLVVARCASDGVSHTANEWSLYRDLHALRRRHMPSFISAVLLWVGFGNVLRRRLQARLT